MVTWSSGLSVFHARFPGGTPQAGQAQLPEPSCTRTHAIPSPPQTFSHAAVCCSKQGGHPRTTEQGIADLSTAPSWSQGASHCLTWPSRGSGIRPLLSVELSGTRMTWPSDAVMCCGTRSAIFKKKNAINLVCLMEDVSMKSEALNLCKSPIYCSAPKQEYSHFWKGNSN